MRIPAPAVALLLLPCVSTQAADPYGLQMRPSFSAFHGGALPENAPVVSGTWSVKVAFPNLTFVNAMGLLPVPGTNTLVVWEREGRVYAFDNHPSTSVKTSILDISNKVQGWDDSGLLGLAFHPNFAHNRHVFLYYSYVPPGTVKGSMTKRPPVYTPIRNRLSRFTMNANGTLNAASETIFIDQISASVWHNGGGLFFHPGNGFLYLTNGDDASKDPQSLSYGFHGGVIRIDVDQRGGAISHPPPRAPLPAGSVAQHYYIPNDNPFVGQPGVLEEFFALGLRSPHRMTIDPPTGRIFIGDVGDGAREEISVIEPGESGLNFQWDRIEGLNGDLAPPYIGINKRPVLDYTHNEGSAVIGGYVYRGSEFPQLYGRYLFGDNGTGHIYVMDESTTPAGKTLLCTLPFGAGPNSGSNYTGLSSFGLDAQGEIYLCQMSSLGGQIYRLSSSGPEARQMPLTLSETGLFDDLAALAPASGFLPYEVNTPLWSDASKKRRWFAIPDGQKIAFHASGPWGFPAGSVFLKHFDLPVDETNPAVLRRLETRVLVRDDQGWVYGGSYKWREDGSDADLVVHNQAEDIEIATSGGGTRTQTWFYPGRQDCLACHTRQAGGVLGLHTAQNNLAAFFSGTGVTDNQLRAWNHAGYFEPSIQESTLPDLPRMAAIDDEAASVELRARSYLASNCAHCHRPGIAHVLWDARFEIPLDDAGILDGPVVNRLGVDNARVIAPQDVPRSLLHKRLSTASEHYKMPPLAKNVVDAAAVALIEQWIASAQMPLPKPLPAPWASLDIGTGVSAQGGAAAGTGGTFLVRGGGEDISGTRDGFHFVHRELVGDGTIIARVVSQENTHEWAKAGVMIRENLSADARHAMMVTTPGNGLAAEGRARAGGPSFNGPGQAGAAPIWVRLTRRGNLFLFLWSEDGVTWHEQHRRTLALPARTRAGLCVTSTAGDTLGAVTFDHVRFFPQAPFVFTGHPQSQLVKAGETALFEVATEGDPPGSFSWQRNGRTIVGERDFRLGIDPVQLGHAGAHRAIAGNRLFSEEAFLTVHDEANFNPNIPEGGTAVLTVPVAGPYDQITWFKNDSLLPSSSRVEGVNQPRLRIFSFNGDDAAAYTCVINAHGATAQLGPYQLRLLRVPVSTTAAPPPAAVSGAFLWQLSADEPATTFLVSGLPSGLSYDAKTNRITGVPNQAGDFAITLTPVNAAGAGAAVTFNLSIEALTGVTYGSFAGLIERHSEINSHLGGRLVISIRESGFYSGKVWQGRSTSAQSFSGRLQAQPGGNAILESGIGRGSAALLLRLEIDRVTGAAAGSLRRDDITSTSAAAWQSPWNRANPATAQVGTFTTALIPDAIVQSDAALYPQGNGFLTWTIKSDGTVLWAGKATEGAALSGSTRLGRQGQLPLFQLLRGSTASLLGVAMLNGDDIDPLSGHESSFFAAALPASNRSRVYRNGIPWHGIVIRGGRYTPPAGLILDLPAAPPENAGITLNGGGLDEDIVVPLFINASHRAASTGDNPANVRLRSLQPRTGLFSGTFASGGTFSGLIIPRLGQGAGYHLRATGTGAVQSGKVTLEAR